MGVYVDYVIRYNMENNIGSYYEVEQTDGGNDQFLKWFEFKKDITDGKTSITITGMDISDYYFCMYCDSSIEMPDKIMDRPVTAIAPYVSESSCGEVDITAVYLPGTIKSIGRCAFINMENMDSVEIPASVTEIGSYAFGYSRSFDEDDEEVFEKNNDFVIYCLPGTAGEKYAKDNGFKYKTPIRH